MHCGSEIPDGSAFCLHCGQPIGVQAVNILESAPTRDIIFRRDTRYTGSAIPFEIYFDDESIGYLRTGDIYPLRGVDYDSHSFYVIGVSPIGATKKAVEKARKKASQKPTIVPAGEKNLTYWLSASLGGISISLE